MLMHTTLVQTALKIRLPGNHSITQPSFSRGSVLWSNINIGKQHSQSYPSSDSSLRNGFIPSSKHSLSITSLMLTSTTRPAAALSFSTSRLGRQHRPGPPCKTCTSPIGSQKSSTNAAKTPTQHSISRTGLLHGDLFTSPRTSEFESLRESNTLRELKSAWKRGTAEPGGFHMQDWVLRTYVLRVGTFSWTSSCLT
jgi:hypothetical protein